MGTYRSFKTEVVGPAWEVASITQLIDADEELKHSLNKWDQNIKNWTPEESLKRLSEHCDRSYVLLTTVEELQVYQTIYYQQVAMNALCPTS